MGPKRNAPSGATQGGIASSPAPSSTASSAARPSASSSSSSSPRTHPTTSSSSSTSFANLQTTVQNLLRTYDKRTPGRVKMIDAFMVYLMVQGLLQFTYCVVGGGYPFNAFLSGFAATVGQFVLTASLRIQTNPENRKDFAKMSDERAFADYVLSSLLLHFFCVNFIN